MIALVRTLVMIAFITTLLLGGLVVNAQVELYPDGACVNTGGTSDICKKGQDADIAPVIQGIVNVMLYVAGVVAVFFVIFGGFKFITSAGDSGKAESARKTIVYALVGLAAVVFSYAIANIVVTRIIGA